MTDDKTMWIGTTSSPLQTEGVAPAADWSRWERDRRVPRSNDGNGVMTNFRDDYPLLAGLGGSHIRIGLDWARLEPQRGRIDSEAFDHYEDQLKAAKSAGLAVIATLQQTTLPGWFADDSPGFRDRKNRELDWARHVDRCAERYQDLVDVWVPIDDPVGWAIRGFLLGNRPPGMKDPVIASEAIEGALLANHTAWELLRSGAKPVMGVFGAPTVFSSGPEADPQRRHWTDLWFTSWITAIRDGELVVPGLPVREMPELAGAFDVVGLVHDHPIAVDRHGVIVPYPQEERRADNGFSPIANELGELVSYVSSELPNRDLVIAAHGVATTDDEWRERILEETLDVLTDARELGIPLMGYLHDTGIDGYEGPYGFNTNRGLISRAREIKDSGLSLQARLT
ncbi:MAG: family 1 glycosylhydrolase [Acidimicrobiales bacterium]